MKKCARCNKEKDENEFIKNSYKSSGLSCYCKECKRILDKEYYKNSENRRQQIKAKREENRKQAIEFIKKYLLEHPCVDCGNTDIRVLEFDHMNGDKEDNISTMARTFYKADKVKAEVAKCEIRCANCHKIRHSKINGSWRNIY